MRTKIDSIAEIINYNEDQPLINLENSLNFYSLRKEIKFKEGEWLKLQGDGEWDLTTDPDSHFILEDTERTLLNVGNEFIIRQTEDDYKIYKLYDNAVVVFDWSEIETLKEMNLDILTPSQLLNDLSQYNGRIRIEMPDSLIGIDPFVPSVPDYGPCKKRNDIRYIFDTSNKRRIKTVSKFHDPILLIRDSVLKAKTKVYKKSKLLGWIPANATILVQLDSDGRMENCEINEKDPYTDYGYGTRHKVKVKWILYNGQPKAVKHKIRSTHRHSGHEKVIDFYDGTVTHL